MSESRELQVAHSLLDDLHNRLHEFETIQFSDQYVQKARELQHGDLERAFNQIQKATAPPEDVSFARGRAHYIEGLIHAAVIDPQYLNLGLFDPYFLVQMIPLFGKGIARRYWTKRFGALAVESFQKSIQAAPNQLAYYQMGQVYLMMGDRAEAIEALKMAQTGDDQEVAVDAAKTLARM